MSLIKKQKPKSKSRKLSWWKEQAWKLFSKYVRLKHANEAGYAKCYTCEKFDHWKTLQCGHGIPGRNNAVLFDEEICRPQCMQCNIFKHGSHHIFVTKLQIENGTEWWLKKLAGSNVAVKIGRNDCEQLIARLKASVESLEKNGV